MLYSLITNVFLRYWTLRRLDVLFSNILLLQIVKYVIVIDKICEDDKIFFFIHHLTYLVAHMWSQLVVTFLEVGSVLEKFSE